MAIPNNLELYEKAKAYADKIYKKPSAFKSAYIVKKYKELGGLYTDDKSPKNLKRWFKEGWINISKKGYPVYRPTKKISRQTPLTVKQISSANLKKQIALKQKLRGDHNLPKFRAKKTKRTTK